MGLNFIKVKGPEGVKVKEVQCSSALSHSGLESDYALNPYTGCSHGCVYCYSPFVIREDRGWGTFVDVKRNVPKVLAEELKKKKGTVRIGSVTDPYQPVEESCEVTRLCLMQLSKKDVPTIVQTKSSLVTRDVDIFKKMDVDVGLTITSLEEDFVKRFEPGASGPGERLDALEELVDAGVSTWVFIGPMMPLFNDEPEELVKEIRSRGVDEIYMDKLNMRDGIWKSLEGVLDEEMMERYKLIYSGGDYFRDKKKMYERLGRPVF